MKKGYRPLNNREINITDKLFGHYVDMVAEVVLPYQWNILNDRVEGAERSHCLENFRIAAGEKTGEFYGTVFQDTDVYKWLEAVAYCMESGKDGRFSFLADEVIDLIARAQQPDGYLNTYYTIVKPEGRWTNLLEGHELYSAGYLIEAAVAYFNATGKRRLLDVAIRFADLISVTFGPREGQKHGYPGHQEIELALVRLYRVTGEKKYLDTARYFIDQRGREPNYFLSEIANRNGDGIFPEFRNYDLKYSQAHVPPVKQRSIEGHAVRAMYLCSAMADLALECDDEALKEACVALWESTTERRMFITGGLGSSGHLERFTTDYDLPNDRTYCETCASVGLMMFGQRMASLTGDAEYYEAVERALCNTVLAGINSDGLKYFYVNPLEVWPAVCLPATSLAHVKPVRQEWFSVACCPTNVARTLSSLGQYIYAADDEALYIHQFISSQAKTEVDGQPVSLSMEADILRTGRVSIRTDGPIRLRLRIPRYADQPAFTLNGEPVEPLIVQKYARFDLQSSAEIVLSIDLKPRWVAADERVRADAGKAALMLGPFVYCLEETDNGENLTAVSILPEAEVQPSSGLAELPGDMPRLEYKGYRVSHNLDALYGQPLYEVKDVRLAAVPYCLWCNRTPGEMLIWQRVRF
ncbi:MAG: glycoside hydrolase family 127 protein [Spirochaetales bacterium]|nr:glycoside hydrolase family 127 protein [Spirochaetales bacterium]